jgi:hypothetical protein
MSRLEMSLLRSAAVGAVVVFSCSLAVAAEKNADIEIAETTFASTGVSWQPAVSYESAVLTVSGPGDLSMRREFAAGEALVFRVDDTNQAALEDGQYAWELRFSPVTDAVVKEVLRAARASGDTSEIENLKKQGRLPAETLVTSGYFRVQGGSIIVANDAEASTRRGGGRVGATGSKQTVDTDSDVPTKDQVILDDLIVDGSACVGMDCVNGESFGFDTIRIKENNLRIRAVDTSSTSSFPSRDWQITFNDSANGGANKFSIDDIDGGRTPFTLEAGAPSHSLYVDDGGRLGLGTSTPVVDIHVKTGNTPTLRLEQDGSSGFTPQTWDVAGNEAGFFIRDATNGSALPFRIQPGSDGESLFIKPTGVEVNVAFSAVSDVNKKTGLTPVDPTDALDRVAELPVTTWSFTSDPSGTTHLGPSAQDFYRTFDIGSDDRHIAPLDAAGVALAAIQGLNAKLEATDDALQRDDESLEAEDAVLAARLAEVEKQNAELADRLAELERLLASTIDSGQP